MRFVRLVSPARLPVGVLTLALVAGLTALGSAPVSPQLRLAARSDVATSSGSGVRNVVFYYDGETPLKPAYEGALRRRLGKPSIVVTTSTRSTEADNVAAIHGLGAKAYRYVQFYWSPNDPGYEGLNLRRHPNWAYCRKGSTPSLGRTTRRADGTKLYWHFVDANERGARKQFRAMLQHYKAMGWDGIMVDRGEAATEYAKDAYGHPIWAHASSCTKYPAYRRGIPFASAFVRMLDIAKEPAARLHVLFNNGRSPYDVRVPFRPNPYDPDCRAHRMRFCSRMNDVWSRSHLVLNETAAHPYDQQWSEDFAANRESERNPRHGRHTVALITTATLGGVRHQKPYYVYYEWSRVKLFNLPVAVNTGDGGCSGSSGSGVCNRHRLYPILVNTRFGTPITAGPRSRSCSSGSSIHCVWVRHYYGGAVVVNASAKYHRVFVHTKTARCKYVYSLWAHQPLRNNRCVHGFYVNLSPWSGRPVRYRDTPW